MLSSELCDGAVSFLLPETTGPLYGWVGGLHIPVQTWQLSSRVLVSFLQKFALVFLGLMEFLVFPGSIDDNLFFRRQSHSDDRAGVSWL